MIRLTRIMTVVFAALVVSGATAVAQPAPGSAAPAAQPKGATPATPQAAAPGAAVVPTPRRDTPTYTQLPISAEQESKIKAMVGENRGGASAPGTIAADATLPAHIELRDLPADLGLGPYGYAVVGGQVAVVDRDTRRVIQVIR
jgi:hypothetical protein